MVLDPQDLPDDLDACHQLIIDLQGELQQAVQQQGVNDQQAETIEQQQRRIEALQHELDLLRRHIFGPRRERFTEAPGQGKLFEVGEQDNEQPPEEFKEEDAGSAPPKPRRRGHGRRRLPEHLRRETIEYKLADDELPCPCCGKPRVKVSETVHEQLEFIPAQLFVKRHVRYVYACSDEACNANMQAAEKPVQPIEKGLAGPGLLAFIIASKLSDHLPLYRQEDILTRAGLHISRSTQSGWMAACGRLAEPLYRRMVQRLLASHVVATDDTTTPFLDPPRDRTATGYFWSYFGDERHPYVCYDFTRQRNRAGPEAFLGEFRGILQGDAFSGYIELAKDSSGRIVHAGCWSHARRYFDRACDKAPVRAVHEALDYIQRLYSVEHEFDELAAREQWDADRRARERLAWRQARSLPILADFHGWLKRQRDSVLPSSPLGEAISYTLNQWESLQVYTRDGAVSIDNNHSENVLRQQVLGRKNWLFLGREDAGHTAAILYSLVATCRRLRIDPYAYLRDVLERLPTIEADDQEKLDALLPDRWIGQHSEHRLQHRQRESSQAAERRRDRRARRRRLEAAQSRRKQQ